jgi:transporter family-2 protein
MVFPGCVDARLELVGTDAATTSRIPSCVCRSVGKEAALRLRRVEGMTAAAALLALLAGFAGSVQVAVMGRFGGRIGVLAALAFATGVQLLFAVVLLLAVRRGAGIGAAFRAPPWMWAAGLMGLLVVFSITFAQPRIGATTTIGILITGQLVMGVLIDRFGLFGVDAVALTWTRIAGVVLLSAGAALTLSR